MAVATRTISSLSATFTQTQLSTALQAAFASAGFSSVFDSYSVGTDLFLVYAFVSDVSKTYGTTYLRLRISNTFIISQQIYATWSVSSRPGSGNSVEVSYSALLNTSNVMFVSLNGTTESRLVMITQGTTFIPLGLIVPATMRASWNLNSHTNGYMFTTNTMVTLRSSALNQFTSNDNDIALVGTTRLGTANTTDNERDLLTGLVLLNQGNTGFAGKTSDDIGIGSFNGSTRYDIITKSGTSQQYLVLLPGSGGVAIRIV